MVLNNEVYLDLRQNAEMSVKTFDKSLLSLSGSG